MISLREKAEELGIALTDRQLAQFEIYYELLTEKNKVMNLTAITEREDVILKHFVSGIGEGGVWIFFTKNSRCRDGSRISGNSFKDCISWIKDRTSGFSE